MVPADGVLELDEVEIGGAPLFEFRAVEGSRLEVGDKASDHDVELDRVGVEIQLSSKA